MRRAPVLFALALALLGAPGLLQACPACFGQAAGPMIDAARLGTWLLLGVVLAMQAAFASFFLYLRRQARRAEADTLHEQWRSRHHRHPGPAPSGARA